MCLKEFSMLQSRENLMFSDGLFWTCVFLLARERARFVVAVLCAFVAVLVPVPLFQCGDRSWPRRRRHY
jgi:hypothetical protein